MYTNEKIRIIGHIGLKNHIRIQKEFFSIQEQNNLKKIILAWREESPESGVRAPGGPPYYAPRAALFFLIALSFANVI
jgi:hypothetical protein